MGRSALATLTMMNWDRPVPLPGEYLKTPNGRTSYMVVKIDMVPPGKSWVFKARCERRPAFNAGLGDRVHTFYWMKRG